MWSPWGIGNRNYDHCPRNGADSNNPVAANHHRPGAAAASASNAPCLATPAGGDHRRTVHAVPLGSLPLSGPAGQHRHVDMYFSLGDNRRRLLTGVVEGVAWRC